ncbi:MAG: pilus assembly protein PilP [Deltaproteobacteria bacterium]|nr:pilus assembly protein PilP [Deltaproteobacteria bacterium]
MVIPAGRVSESISPEQFNTEQLHLKAIVWNTEKKMALSETDEGKTFIAKPGTKVGKKGGKVSRIDDNMVVISGSEGEVTFKLKD